MIWTNSDSTMGIDLSKVQGFIIGDDNILCAYMGEGELPYEVEDQDDIDSFVECFSRSRRKVWINKADSCTLDLSVIRYIIISNTGALVYDDSPTPLSMSISEGQSLRETWLEYLTW